MKDGEAGINAHIQLTTTSLAECVKIVRRDGTIIYATSLDSDLVYDGNTYASYTNMSRTALESPENFTISNLDIQGLINANAITEADILADKYSGASVYYFLINFNNVADGIIKMQRGFIGEVELRDGIFVAEVKGLAQRFQKNLLRTFTPECDVQEFADSRCGLTASDYLEAGAIVSAVTDKRIFQATGTTSTNNYFNYGKIEWKTGDNSGLFMEVKSNDATPEFTLFLPMPFTIQIGDTFDIWKGCDRTAEVCKNTYNNKLNFRGFDQVSGRTIFNFPDMRI